MKKQKKYKETYHNNELNFHVSDNNTSQCSIQDIDLYMSSLNSKQQFFIEYKFKNVILKSAQLFAYHNLITAKYKHFKNTYGYVVIGELPHESLWSDNVKYKPVRVLVISKNDHLSLNSNVEDFICDEFILKSRVHFKTFFDIELDYYMRKQAITYENEQAEIQF
jgi:hypothetical protein